MEKQKTMMDYILESPEIVVKNVEQSKTLTKPLVDLFLKKEYKTIWIVASGSSYNSGHCARMFIREYLDIEVKIIPPYTFCHYENNIKEEDFVFVISQSGYSTNAIDALKKLRELGREAIGITGDINSDFRLFADPVIDYGVGIETVGYVTKGVTTLATFLILFALEAGLVKNKVSIEEYNKIKEEMILAMDAHKIVTEETFKLYEKNYKALTSMTNCYVCGCGSNYGLALEGALKIGETVQIPSIGLELEEYIHGPNLQLSPNYTVFIIDSGDPTSKRAIEIFYATKAVTDKVFIISNDLSIDDDHAIRVPVTIRETLSPLYGLPFFQIISYQVTEDLNRWKKHPLFDKFKEKAVSKSEAYGNR